VRAVDPDGGYEHVPQVAMVDPRLSLMAKGLLGLLLRHQGAPIDPYEHAVEDAAEMRAAVEELVSLGYAVRVAR
jgi:hypothetical protein